MWSSIRTLLDNKRAALWLGAALLVVLVLALAYCSGRRDGKLASEVEQARIEREVLERGSSAAEKASEARVRDAVRVTEQRKELEDASRDCDEASGECDVKRGCTILRQQAFDTSDIAACVRLGI